ncbi:MAG: four helix bundle protein [Candidatus Aminicenantes bacterium]|nr:four helix bundle protein [Candidatus Aminicenantes bacterium]
MKKTKIHDINIINRAVQSALFCFDLATQLKEIFFFTYAERLKKAALGFYINVTEATESSSVEEYLNFINITRQSLLETAYILSFLNEKQLLCDEVSTQIVNDLEQLTADLGNN